MKKRILSLAISAALVLTMLPAGALAAGDKGTPPVYNKATGCYEISTPDQLLYLSGSWKDGAPRDGHYVLTADIDMSGVKGFKPIASKKDKGFIGTFDGQFHAIKGLRVEYEKKYAGLFGYVGRRTSRMLRCLTATLPASRTSVRWQVSTTAPLPAALSPVRLSAWICPTRTPQAASAAS